MKSSLTRALAVAAVCSFFVLPSGLAHAQPLDVTWTELTPPTALAMDSFWGGFASFDGDRIAVNRPGAIDVYRWNGTTATLETTLVATSGDSMGFPDTMVLDHGRVIANARLAADGPAVYEFVLNGTTWSQVARFPNPMPPLGDPLMSLPALSGTRLVIGQPYGNTARGLATLIRETSAPFTWTNGNSTRVDGIANYELGGQTNAIDGADVAIATMRGAAGGQSQTGVVRVYHDSGSSLDLLFRIDNPTPGPDDQFGVALDMDARGVYVGAHYDDTMASNAGAVYVFDRTTGALVQTILGNTALGRFGASLAVSGDLMVIGQVGNQTMSGVVYLYTRSASGMWTLRSTIPQFEGHLGSFFGNQTQAVGHVVVVSGPSEPVAGATNAGRVWIGIATERDGGACTGDDGCTHGHCVSGICCATACACGTCGGGTCDSSTCDAGAIADAGVDAAVMSIDDAGVDAAPMPDAGRAPDAGSQHDAGSLGDAGSRADGAMPLADAGAVPRVPLSCTCRAGTPTRSGWATTLLSMLAMAWWMRRRAR